MRRRFNEFGGWNKPGCHVLSYQSHRRILPQGRRRLPEHWFVMEQSPASVREADHPSSVRGAPMRSRTLIRAVLGGATAGLLLIAGSALAGPPPVVWSQANPGGLTASVGAVAW